jgi:membrane protease YdiL (CAAX protease family)
MPTVLSNSLYLAVAPQAPDALPPVVPETVPTEPKWFFTLMAVGIVLMFIWAFRRIAQPAKFTLAKSPGRKSQFSPLVLIAMLMFAYSGCMLLTMATQWVLAKYFMVDHVTLLTLAAMQTFQIPAWLLIGRWGFNHGLTGMGFTFRRWPTSVLRGITTALIAIPLCHLCQMGIVYLGQHLGAPTPTTHPLLEAIQGATWPWRMVIIVSAVVLAPLAEELLFRGLIQSSLRRFFGSPWIAIGVTSALFGAVHLPIWPAVLPLAIFGVLLGYSYERTGKLLPAIVAHSLFNATYILIAIIYG